MNDHLPINYRGYWDVPRIFFVDYLGLTYLFDCTFDEDLDDYPDDFEVFLMPPLSEEEMAGSWADHWKKAIRKVGSVPVSAVRFDPTRRKTIGAEVFETLAPPSPQANGTLDHVDAPSAHTS